ncbi:hypothetical protein QBC46DRAFT_345594 [Diplogelasinospora grovesii]|uniref:Uncharacterized protein n=1 Tax=Diplogelasinospora grovesii TaxID=303347 RepID=A0AAN6MZM9_9PEZI|nr:hypothetical protein QBC46DRAFT_345594 [Diplogelasinospora grovesii]
MAPRLNLVVPNVCHWTGEVQPGGPWRLYRKTAEQMEEEREREAEIKDKTLLGKIKSFVSLDRTPPHTYRVAITGTTDYSTDQIADILGEFLQPDSKTSLEAVTRAIMVLMPEEYFKPESIDFSAVVCVIAGQIPYSHPAHHKLARLLQYLGTSRKFIQVYHDEEVPVLEQRLFVHQALREELSAADRKWALGCSGFDHFDHKYVNLNAFAAILEHDNLGPSERFAVFVIRRGLEGDVGPCIQRAQDGGVGAYKEVAPEHLEDHVGPYRHVSTEESDVLVMGAAVWIIYNGTNLFRQMVLYPDEDAEDDWKTQDRLDRYWALGRRLRVDPELRRMKPRSVERWRFWQGRLDMIGKGRGDASRECRSLASRAASMAEAIEKSMLFY